MAKNGGLSWKWLLLPAALALFAALVSNVGGWGAFALDVGKAALAQAAVALALYWVATTALRRLSPSLLSRDAELIVFALAAIVALPILRLVFHRPLDLYDAAQTAALTLLFGLRGAMLRSRRRVRPVAPSRPEPGQSQIPTAERRYSYSPHYAPRAASSEYQRLYNHLVARAGGDRSVVERLIARQRQRTPGASPEGQLSNIIAEWDRDRNR